jgi:hypothetical protein
MTSTLLVLLCRAGQTNSPPAEAEPPPPPGGVKTMGLGVGHAR